MNPSPRTVRPDPRVSAHLHCAGEIEEAIRLVVAPLHRALDELGDDPTDDRQDGGGPRLWMFRNHRPVAHLELHVHGPAALEAEIRDHISEACEAFFSTRPAAADPEAEAARDAPPPDRGLLWAPYRPSHVVFGGPPFQEDDGFRDGFTRGLAVAGRRIAETFEAAGEPLSFGRRQVVLWGLVIPGLQALGLSAADRSSYLRYHRDWLMRFPLMQQPDRDERMTRLREHFDQRAARMEGALASLRSAMGEPPAEGSEPVAPEDADESERGWFDSIRTLDRRVVPLCDCWDPEQDPWAERPRFAPFFKLFHIAANPLGLTLPEEAFTYHLLLRAVTSEPRSGAR